MRTAVVRTKQCLFCTQPAGSAEHVIPEWLSKRMAIRDLGFQPAHYSKSGGLTLRPQIKCEHFKTNQVCGDCNHGWMADLEAWAQNNFGPCVQPNIVLADLVQLQSIPGERDMIIRWLLKTAIIVERAFPMAQRPKCLPASILSPVARNRRQIFGCRLDTLSNRTLICTWSQASVCGMVVSYSLSKCTKRA